MKIGEELYIKGRLGYFMNPKMIVVGKREGMLLLRSVNSKEGGILSGINCGWYGESYIKRRVKKI